MQQISYISFALTGWSDTLMGAFDTSHIFCLQCSSNDTSFWERKSNVLASQELHTSSFQSYLISVRFLGPFLCVPARTPYLNPLAVIKWHCFHNKDKEALVWLYQVSPGVNFITSGKWKMIIMTHIYFFFFLFPPSSASFFNHPKQSFPLRVSYFLCLAILFKVIRPIFIVVKSPSLFKNGW